MSYIEHNSTDRKVGPILEALTKNRATRAAAAAVLSMTMVACNPSVESPPNVAPVTKTSTIPDDSWKHTVPHDWPQINNPAQPPVEITPAFTSQI